MSTMEELKMIVTPIKALTVLMVVALGWFASQDWDPLRVLVVGVVMVAIYTGLGWLAVHYPPWSSSSS